MNSFINFCNQFTSLTNEAEHDLLGKLETKVFQKGDYLLENGAICRRLFFITTGLVKLSFNKSEKEFIMRFFFENSMFTLLDSYLTQKPSHYQIVALEQTYITFIRHDEMEALCQRHHAIETFFRKLVSMAALNMMDRISEMLEDNATQRYNNFTKENNTLLQRISLGDLANYLGITQVSLSRIRSLK